MRWSALALGLLWFLTLLPTGLAAERLPDGRWQLLTVAYPPDRDVEVLLGGSEKTLTARGVGKVKWKDRAAALEIAVENLPFPSEMGWTGQQYVLWAVDSEKRMVNLGIVPLQKKGAKWKAQVPFRIFGLLITSEKNPQAATPSTAVVLESLLPTNSNLVVPVFRVSVDLAPSAG